jgi:ribosomal-protein-alanine N-acetyltransferase
MNSDPEVMRYFLAPMTRAESLDTLSLIREEIARRGWGVWAVEVDGVFAGMVGLHVPEWSLPFSPCTEVLWRLRKEFWGRGIAYEAASQAVDDGFSKADLDEIVSFTTPPNLRSIRLMELRRGSPEQRPLVSAVLGLVLLSPGYLLVRHVSRMAGGHWGFNPRYEFAMLFLVLVGLWLVYRATLSRRYFVLVATGQRETKLVFHPGRRVVAIREFLREAGRDYRWEIVDRSGPNR